MNEFCSKMDFCRKIFVSGATVLKKELILDKIAIALGKNVASDKYAIEKALGSTKRKIFVILVLDEIDFLLRDFVYRKEIKEDSVFGSVLKWASDSNFRMALIGISNSVADENARLLHMSAKVSYLRI